jgi:hypothetical protein
MSFSWGSGPTIPVNVASNISRSGMSYSGYVTVSLGAVTGKSTFGYYIEVTVNGTTKRLKENYPDQWSSGAYSASFPVSGSTTASTISVAVTMGTNAPRGSSTYYESISIGSYSSGSGSGGTTGPTAGASTPTLSKNGAKLGEKVTIYTNRGDRRYTHKVTYTVGGETGTIATGVGASCEWTPPTSLIDKVTTSGAACTITCTTYYGSTNKGTVTARLTLYPPDGAAPTVTDGWISAERDNSLIPGINAWVVGYSKVKITFDPSKASGNFNATIVGFSVQYDGETVAAVDNTATTKALTGTAATVRCMVTDSRGNTTTETVEVEALAYAPPTITEASVYRCDDALLAADDGVHIAARATAGCTGLNGENTVTLTAAYKALNAADYGAEVALQSGVTGMVTGSADISTMQSYTVRLTATDKVGNSVTYTRAVPTKSVTFHLKGGGKGAAFGKYAENDDYLDCQWKAKFAQSVEIAEGLTVGGQALADIIKSVVTPMLPSVLTIDAIYPVGSIYMSVTENANPEALFPGTHWERIAGKFLLASSAGLYAVGATGGEASVILTASQMPSHTHGGSIESGGEHSHSFSGNQSGGSSQTAEGKGASDSHYTFYTSTDGSHSHSLSISEAGGGGSHNNMPPYLVVHMWKRIAGPETT